jgi:multicomponent K+:H+ antiporter subunit A
MIMSLIAMSGGIVLYLLLRKQLKRGRFKYPPLIGASTASACSSSLVLMMRWPAGSNALSTRRLQTQLFLLVLAAVLAGLIPMLHSGLSWGDRPKIPGPSCSSPCGCWRLPAPSAPPGRPSTTVWRP